MIGPFAALERTLERIPINRTEIEQRLEKGDHDLDAAAYNKRHPTGSSR